ncbi:MAG: O-acetylhomoserine aminocarboxypropyltransferase/cysteine synthase, partial [Oscillospiraceae bacterium]|nr:O-acetylhomoserine aminocarboxypropyltransferase/cysteine synthase [Oscillospiraceae bacterium]
ILEETEGIKVNYPGLKSSPYHELVERQMQGRGGAIVTIGAGSRERAYKLINSLKYASIATNIGDVRTLVIHPASTIYTHSTEAQRQSAGVYEDTIRISVGIEDINDLADDFRQAVAHL